MIAEVLSLPRGGAGARAPLVPANIDVSAADIMAHDIKHLQKRSARMSAEHFGVWWRLHIASHLEEVTGTLPNDDIDLAIAAGFLAEGVERWRAMKEKVLEDWLLCSDGRWHHPNRARNVLHIWIGGLERDRRGMLGNTGKSAKARACVAALEDQIEFGRDALARIDPRDRYLLALDERISKWPSKADAPKVLAAVPEATATGSTDASYYDSVGDRESRNTAVTVTLKETKRSEVNRKNLEMPDRRSGHDLTPSEKDSEKEGGDEAPLPDMRNTYPPGAFAIWYNRFPLKEGRKKAEAAFARVQASECVSFPDLMSGLERYIRNKPKGQDWCYPATWLNEERWRDGIALPVAGEIVASARSATESVFVAVGTPSWEAWQKEARRLGKPGWPTIERGAIKGWSFPSERPPGHDSITT